MGHTRGRLAWRSIPIAGVEPLVIGDAMSAADHVRFVRHHVYDQMSIFSAILMAIIDLDAEVSNGALDL